MIAFPTNQWKYFNQVIHRLIESLVIDVYEELDDYIEEILPKYLWREQRLKCLQVVRELYYWSDREDEFIHQMSAFHEFVLYSIVRSLSYIQNDDPELFEAFFDKETLSLLLPENWESDDILDEEISLTFEEYYSDVSNFESDLFMDTDFLMIADLVNYRRMGIDIIEERLGINIDYYFELLPMDIQNQYRTGHITLTSEILSFVDYLKMRIEKASLYQLFWDNDKPILEKQIQILIENILDAYFHQKEVDLSREVFIGNGKVDFKLFRSHETDEKVLLEIKRASSSKFRQGYEKQLQEYIKAANYRNGVYLVFCFTDEEVLRVERFISEYVSTNTLYLNIELIDVRRRLVPSKL
ncbi:hypothetical protein [Streptococcus loxodontisalivarius]|uniref:Uncharacterized protein n=1 Tax=Streptococcus loxodontisalivarius TaxID=1349415 RepID=A0ABS2PU89_9STRE|nr:hypothetical protein [Streptococcus loxodontisalivarius]MBM7643604.1 hypothetical protein [Streptococcus loxodontisalivarius]